MASVRYLVKDVDAAVSFYTGALGFALVQQFGPAMAILARDDLRLWLAGPLSSAAKPLADGAQPQPGGWNRIVLEVVELDATLAQLRAALCRIRNEPITGPGGRQALVEDPSGNLVELFQPA